MESNRWRILKKFATKLYPMSIAKRQTFSKFFYHYLPYISWVDVIYLTCLVFLKSPWWLVWIFCAPTPLPENIKLRKWVEKYFMARQYMSKIFRDHKKNPRTHLPTYLMYGPILSELSDSSSELLKGRFSCIFYDAGINCIFFNICLFILCIAFCYRLEYLLVLNSTILIIILEKKVIFASTRRTLLAKVYF